MHCGLISNRVRALDLVGTTCSVCFGLCFVRLLAACRSEKFARRHKNFTKNLGGAHLWDKRDNLDVFRTFATLKSAVAAPAPNGKKSKSAAIDSSTWARFIRISLMVDSFCSNVIWSNRSSDARLATSASAAATHCKPSAAFSAAFSRPNSCIPLLKRSFALSSSALARCVRSPTIFSTVSLDAIIA